MSGDEDGTGDGSSAQICKENTATRIKDPLCAGWCDCCQHNSQIRWLKTFRCV